MKKNNEGFTIFEIVVAFFIGSLVIGIFSFLFVNFLKTYQFSFDENLAVSEAQDSLRRMMGEIRETRPSEIGSYPLVETSDQQLIFYADTDRDGITERVRYFLDGIVLKKGIVEPTGNPLDYPTTTETTYIVTEHIRNQTQPVFYYYNGDWPGDVQNNPLVPSNRLLQTRLIKIQLKVNINENQAPSDFTLTSSTQLRNLKDNL